MSNDERTTVLITGATAGLGLECARALLAEGGHRVLLAARDEAKARRVQASLPDPGETRVVSLDLASLEGVRRAADTLVAGPRLGAIVCNAGVHEAGAPRFTTDGLETTFAVNHLAHQLLVMRLLGHITDDARIVVVSSGTHDPESLEGRHNPPASIDVRALAAGREGNFELSAVRRYTTSKLCNVLFVRELDRRLRQRGLRATVNAFDPGAVPGTELTRSWSPLMRGLVRASWLLRLFGMPVSSPSEAGRAMARLVSHEAFAGRSGLYVQLERERPPSRAARDAELARRLYEDSLELLSERSPL